MNLDFPTILVLLTVVTGGIWALDALVLARRRRLQAARLEGAVSGQEAASGAGEGPNLRAAVKEPFLVEISRSFFPVILIVLVLRSFVVEPFRIPSGSMMPTLLIGDFILVNKYAYGIRLPVLDTKVIEVGEPKRGDVVVFRFPEDPSIDFIKRVVALPGDRVHYRNKVLYVNGEPVPQRPVGDYVGRISADYRQVVAQRRVEDLFGREHDILVNPSQRSGGVYGVNGEYVVPEGHYFVFGDNRDNSKDSRFWGPLPEENLVGKAFFIWMNLDLGQDGWVGWERIGSVIH
jgi:signal peptidase I